MSGAAESFIPLEENVIKSLLTLAQQGDFNAKEQLVNANTRLVHSIARRFMASGREPDDLFQVGCIGLLKAIERFDLGYNVCFSTYAVPLIMGEIRRFLRDDGPLSVSRTMKERATQIARKRRELQAEWGREPELWQLAEACGLSDEQALAAIEAVRPPLSINETHSRNDEVGLPIIEQLRDKEENFDEKLIDSINLRAYIDELPERLRFIVNARYFEERTQSELASILGVSQVQVSRLERRALDLIRRQMADHEAS